MLGCIDMPIYFFNIYNDDVTEDFEGTDLPDAEAARNHALLSVRGLAAETVREGHLYTNHRIDILDAARNVMSRVTFGDAVQISKE